MDPFGPIRREALRLLVAHAPDPAPNALRRALFDTHVSIREYARHELQRREALDAAAFYRQALSHESSDALAAAVAGLGETGTAADAAPIRALVLRGARGTRLAAVRALARLDGDASVALFLEVLRDDVPSVARVAGEALRPRVSLIGAAPLWALFQDDPRRHVRSVALSLLAALGKWERLPYLVRALADRDPEIARQADAAVASWTSAYNRSFRQPTAEQLTRLAAGLDEVGASLAPGRLKALRAFHALGTDLMRRSGH